MRSDSLVRSGPGPARIRTVKNGLKTALRIAGLRWHDLGATFGTRLGEAGSDAFTIAELMGHSDIRMTARYVRGTERNQRASVEAARLDYEVPPHNGVTRQEQPQLPAAVKC